VFRRDENGLSKICNFTYKSRLVIHVSIIAIQRMLNLVKDLSVCFGSVFSSCVITSSLYPYALRRALVIWFVTSNVTSKFYIGGGGGSF
jgi:hypothetical protein